MSVSLTCTCTLREPCNRVFTSCYLFLFQVLMTRVILTFGLKFVIPLSKVDENLQRAFKRDAVTEQKFYFRKDILTGNYSRLLSLMAWWNIHYPRVTCYISVLNDKPFFKVFCHMIFYVSTVMKLLQISYYYTSANQTAQNFLLPSRT